MASGWALPLSMQNTEQGEIGCGRGSRGKIALITGEKSDIGLTETICAKAENAQDVETTNEPLGKNGIGGAGGALPGIDRLLVYD